jgi:hypothetical protein
MERCEFRAGNFCRYLTAELAGWGCGMLQPCGAKEHNKGWSKAEKFGPWWPELLSLRLSI